MSAQRLAEGAYVSSVVQAAAKLGLWSACGEGLIRGCGGHAGHDHVQVNDRDQNSNRVSNTSVTNSIIIKPISLHTQCPLCGICTGAHALMAASPHTATLKGFATCQWDPHEQGGFGSHHQGSISMQLPQSPCACGICGAGARPSQRDPKARHRRMSPSLQPLRTLGVSCRKSYP